MSSYMARRHPLALGLLVLVLSPYLLALALVFIVAFTFAAALDMLAHR